MDNDNHNNYQEPEIIEIGRAQDVVLSGSKIYPRGDNLATATRRALSDLEEDDE